MTCSVSRSVKELTQWNKVGLEELAAGQQPKKQKQTKKRISILWNPKVQYHVHNSRYTELYSQKAESTHTLPSYSLEIHITSLSTIIPSKPPPPSGCRQKFCTPFPWIASPPQSRSLSQPKVYKLRSFSLRSFPQLPVFPNSFIEIFFSAHCPHIFWGPADAILIVQRPVESDLTCMLQTRHLASLDSSRLNTARLYSTLLVSRYIRTPSVLV